MSRKQVQYLIVGQGLSGTLMSHLLLEAGQSVLVIDQPRSQAASRVAAGLINPITGRYYVKSWRFDELLPIARATYARLEQLLDISLNEERSILRALLDAGDENSWWARAEDAAYQPYLVDQVELGGYSDKIHPAHSYGEVTRSGRASISKLVKTYGQWLLDRKLMVQEPFDYTEIQKVDGRWRYRDMVADRILFCEGYWGKFNPFFSYLPFRGAKGEILIVRLPEAQFQKILKQKIFIVPLEDDLYWIGATMENHFDQEAPTEAGKSFLINQLDQLLDTPYEVIGHRSGIRPTVKDRRPFLGEHPESKGIYIFNGLGSKGTSMGPFFAKQLTDNLLNDKNLDPEVDIKRYQHFTVN